MSLLSLPAEILSRVGDFLREPDLNCLSQTSHQLHDVFDWLLYRAAKCEKTVRTARLPRAGIIRAASDGNVGAVRKFIRIGADVNQQHGASRSTALSRAMYIGHKPMVESLLDAGADITIPGANRTALDMELSSDDPEMIEILCRYDLPREVFRPKHEWLLKRPPMVRPLRKRAQLLLQNGEIPNLNDYNYFFDNLILLASLDEDVDDLQDLLQQRVQNYPDRCVRNHMALHVAILRGNTALVEAFLSTGADINWFAGEDSFLPPLCASLRNRDIKMALFLYEKGAHITPPSGQDPPMFPIFGAAASGDVATLDFVVRLDANAVARSTNAQGKTPLHYAIMRDRRAPEIIKDFVAARLSPIPMLERLIELGVDVNSRDVYGLRAFDMAIMMGLVEESSFLIEHGALVNVPSGFHQPLYEAALKGQTAIMEVLLQHGASPNAVAKSPLYAVVTAEATSLLVKYGADLDKPWGRVSPLNYAAREGRTEVMAVLLKAGASVTSTDGKGHHPLHNAILLGPRSKTLSTVRLLLDFGAPVNGMGASPCHGQPLCYAVTPPGSRRGVEGEAPDEKLVETLLQHGADIHSFNQDGRNCLHDACLRSSASMVRLLLKYGGDVTKVTAGGLSPLLLATVRNRAEIVSLLIEHGAPLNEQTQCNRLPLYHAVKKGLERIVKILLEHGASPNIAGKTGTTPLHTAAVKGCEGIVSLLLGHGAQVDAKDRRGNTPLSLATFRQKQSIVSILSLHTAN